MTEHQSIASAIARLKTPIYLARQTAGAQRPVISLFTTDRRAPRSLGIAARTELSREGIDAECRVIVTPQGKLRRKSVEEVARSFGSGEIVYDPTGIVGRSTAVVACATRIRRDAAAPITGMFLNPERRTLFVILNQKSFPAGTEALLAKRVEAMSEIAKAVQAWRAETAPSFDLAIRIGFELPTSIRVVPVDRRSVPSFARRWVRPSIAAALGSMFGLGAMATAQAADPAPRPVIPIAAPLPSEPAVARHNFDVLFAGVFLDGGGIYNNDNIAAVGFKGAVPLGQRFGLQVDAAVGTQSYWGIGGHLFWRDPSVGLVGGIASHESLNGLTLDRFGGEAEVYLRNITLRGEVGWQGGDATHSPFAGLDLTFYMHPNFSLKGGANMLAGGDLRAHVGAEWQPQFGHMAGLSVFADGEFGASNYTKVLAGLSLHFGSPGVSLIDRDRKYDPVFGLFHFSTLQNIGYATVH